MEAEGDIDEGPGRNCTPPPDDDNDEASTAAVDVLGTELYVCVGLRNGPPMC